MGKFFYFFVINVLTRLIHLSQPSSPTTHHTRNDEREGYLYKCVYATAISALYDLGTPSYLRKVSLSQICQIYCFSSSEVHHRNQENRFPCKNSLSFPFSALFPHSPPPFTFRKSIFSSGSFRNSCLFVHRVWLSANLSASIG